MSSIKKLKNKLTLCLISVGDGVTLVDNSGEKEAYIVIKEIIMQSDFEPDGREKLDKAYLKEFIERPWLIKDEQNHTYDSDKWHLIFEVD